MKRTDRWIILFLVLIAIVLCVLLAMPVNAEERPWTDETERMLAKTVWGEARGLDAYEQSMVVWCILNRYDSGEFQSTIDKIILADNPKQFHGYDPSFPVKDDILKLCEDVLDRWWNGKDGRTLPIEYVYFYGDGSHNYYSDGQGHTYDFSLPNPYIMKEETSCPVRTLMKPLKKRLLPLI